jgi:hypothetical protein
MTPARIVPLQRRILGRRDGSRVPALVPIRCGRMLASPSSFLRSAAAGMGWYGRSRTPPRRRPDTGQSRCTTELPALASAHESPDRHVTALPLRGWERGCRRSSPRRLQRTESVAGGIAAPGCHRSRRNSLRALLIILSTCGPRASGRTVRGAFRAARPTTRGSACRSAAACVSSRPSASGRRSGRAGHEYRQFRAGGGLTLQCCIICLV